jgi:hypothetical protein
MLLIQDRSGLIREGVLVAIQGDQLRIPVNGGDDVMVFRLLQEGWTSENFDIVTFDLPLGPFEAMGMVPTAQNTLEEATSQQQSTRKTRALVS